MAARATAIPAGPTSLGRPISSPRQRSPVTPCAAPRTSTTGSIPTPRAYFSGSSWRSRKDSHDDVTRRMAAVARGFVLRHTRLGPVPGVDGIRLHLTDEVLPVWHAVQLETHDP